MVLKELLEYIKVHGIYTYIGLEDGRRLHEACLALERTHQIERLISDAWHVLWIVSR